MLSPYSALSLVRQRIHAPASVYGALKVRRIQRYAWFNSRYQFMRQTTEAGFAVDSATRAVFLLSSGPRCAASWPLWTSRSLCWQWHVQG